jgi:hypothetical protein
MHRTQATWTNYVHTKATKKEKGESSKEKFVPV